MQLARPSPPRALISLVPLVDVLLIMLVFFMVTSTYLDLDVIPAVERGEEDAPPPPRDTTDPAPPPPGASGVLLVRLAPDGQIWLRGQALSPAELRAALAAHVAAGPGAVSVLAAPRAQLQALVSLTDLAAEAGVTRLQVLRTDDGTAAP